MTASDKDYGRPPPDPDARIAPDPFATVLPAIAALGAISSIAAINWVAQDKTVSRPKVKRKAGMALRDLESCCLGLIEIFRRFHKNPRIFAGEGATSSPMKFGVHGPRIDDDGARLYRALINDTASMLVLASQNAFDVMAAIEDGEITAPEELYFGFGEVQERLNKLIQNRATIRTCVETGLDSAERLTILVRALKRHKIE
jgi:hypothetical protein